QNDARIARAPACETTGDLLRNLPDLLLLRVRPGDYPPALSRVMPFASPAKRNAIVRAGNRHAAASRPPGGASIARSSPPPTQPFRLRELRTWGRPRRGCGRRRLAPSWPARSRALVCRALVQIAANLS